MIQSRPVRALLLATLVWLAAVPAFGQPAAELQLNVRDTRLLEEGRTELIVGVTGDARPDVLQDDAFTVTEQGAEVSGLEVEPLLESGEDDIALVLAIDVSGSMQGEPIEVTLAAASDLVAQLTEAGVAVQVVAFGATVEVLTELTTDGGEAAAAIEGLEASGSTLLYDAIVTASETLAKSGAQPNLIVFSDGGDNGSDAGLEDAIAAAVAAEVPIVTVALESDDLDAAALDSLAQATEGRVLSTGDLDELASLFEQVAEDIASQYVLRYTSEEFDADTLQLAVSVAAGGATADTSFVVPNTREAPSELIEGPRIVQQGESVFSGSTALIAGLLTAFIALLLIFFYMFAGTRSRGDKVLEEQLSRYIEQGDLRAGRSGEVGAYFRDRAYQLFESTPRPKGFDAKLSRRLEQAAWPLRNGEFLMLVVVLALAVGLLVGTLVNLLGGILLGIIAGLVPVAILNYKRQKRHDRFLAALPDTLQLMAGSLRAGYGVLQAIDTVAKESSPPTSEEFGRVLTEARLGMPVEDALSDMAERIENDDFRWVVLAINIQREVGGNLAELLDTVAEVLREREMLRRQVKVLSAEGRLSAYILLGLPIFLAIYLILVNPEYISTLVTSGFIGFALVGGAVLLMIIGVIWIRNLIKIEV